MKETWKFQVNETNVDIAFQVSNTQHVRASMIAFIDKGKQRLNG